MSTSVLSTGRLAASCCEQTLADRGLVLALRVLQQQGSAAFRDKQLWQCHLKDLVSEQILIQKIALGWGGKKDKLIDCGG